MPYFPVANKTKLPVGTLQSEEGPSFLALRLVVRYVRRRGIPLISTFCPHFSCTVELWSISRCTGLAMKLLRIASLSDKPLYSAIIRKQAEIHRRGRGMDRHFGENLSMIKIEYRNT